MEPEYCGDFQGDPDYIAADVIGKIQRGEIKHKSLGMRRYCQEVLVHAAIAKNRGVIANNYNKAFASSAQKLEEVLEKQEEELRKDRRALMIIEIIEKDFDGIPEGMRHLIC